MNQNIFFLFLLCLLTPAMSLAESNHTSPEKLNPEGYFKTLSKSGNTYIAGQPDQTSLQNFKEYGVTAVISLRTPAEMSDATKVPYDEAAEITALGVEYIQIPMNGRRPYSEDLLDQFMKAYDKHEGRVLLHCKSGVRASQMWTAFLVKHEGMSLAEARQIGEQINLSGAPLNGLLGEVVEPKQPERPTKEKVHP